MQAVLSSSKKNSVAQSTQQSCSLVQSFISAGVGFFVAARLALPVGTLVGNINLVGRNVTVGCRVAVGWMVGLSLLLVPTGAMFYHPIDRRAAGTCGNL